MAQVKDSRAASARHAEKTPANRRAARGVRAAVTINLTEALAELARDGGPVYVFGPDGKPVVALVSVEHARVIEEFEDRRDAALAAKAKAEFIASGEKAVPWDDIKAKAGLER